MQSNKSGVARFRERLLPNTLEYGGTIPFYRHHWGLSGQAAPQQLARIPTISKRANRRSLESMRSQDVTPALLVHSTGTTGDPFIRYRSQSELDAYSEYVMALQKKATAAEAPPTRVLSFNAVPRTIHGGAVAGPQISHQLAIDLQSERGIANAIGLLSNSTLYVVDGRSPRRILVASPSVLAAFTIACQDRNLDFADFNIGEIYCVGDALTPYIKAMLEQNWHKSTIHDVYSCSEIIGGASECQACKAFHFEPIVWPEILAIDADDPIAEGFGELTLTELYPFSQIQPFIRYRTGDLVERIICSLRPDDLAFKPVGRLLGSVIVSGPDERQVVALSAAHAREALEPEVGISRQPVIIESPVQSCQYFVGSPRARLEYSQDPTPAINLVVQATFNPSLYPTAARQMEQRIADRLRDHLKVDGISVHISVAGPHSNLPPLITRPTRMEVPDSRGEQSHSAN